MLISIRNESTNDMEWCLVEFQGEIMGDLEGCNLGQLEISDEGKTARMEIGQQVLQGQVSTLNKAFLVVQKIDTNLSISGYVKKKIMFNSRPQPLPKTKLNI